MSSKIKVKDLKVGDIIHPWDSPKPSEFFEIRDIKLFKEGETEGYEIFLKDCSGPLDFIYRLGTTVVYIQN